ncbi:MAG: hypothetical protein GEU99_25995 [Luteitalea sp.]|nr:hypothetical protein [Luteitalea sp.]
MDLSTTAYGIGTGAVKEANPLMRWAADDPVMLASVKVGGAAGLDWALREIAKRGNRKTAIVAGHCDHGSHDGGLDVQPSRDSARAAVSFAQHSAGTRDPQNLLHNCHQTRVRA